MNRSVPAPIPPVKGAFRLPEAWFPLLALLLCALAYGRWALTLGYIWDDFPIRWIFHEYGLEGLRQYFSVDRPFMPWLYRLTTSLIDFTPLSAHLFALVSRVVSGVALWGLLRLAWPRHKDLAGWAAALFVVYPGFGQQYVSIVYGHFYWLMTAYFASLSLTLLALRYPRRFGWFTAGALVLSAANLFFWEYYFVLDALRPVFIWWALEGAVQGWKPRLRRTIFLWLPYLAVFFAAVYFRSTVLGYQTYQPVFFDHLRSEPVKTLLRLVKRIPLDIFEAVVLAGWKALRTVGLAFKDGGYWLVVLVSAALAGLFFWQHKERGPSRERLPWLLTSLAALALAGGPFWLIDLDVNLYFSNDRFVLPFMVGGSMSAALIAAWLPRRVHLPLLALLVGLSAGVQYHNGYAYFADWERARQMLWQLSWRAPGLQPGTTLLMNDNAFTYYTDISLSAALNWVYQPEPSGRMNYMLLYPLTRLGNEISALTSNQAIGVDYRSDHFDGSTSQVLVATYQPPGCFRFIDPAVEAENTAPQEIIRNALPLTRWEWILPQGVSHLPEETFGAPPSGTWCELYEKADLARQVGDWARVVTLWESAQSAELWPLDAVEYLPFVEAYAHSGDWEQALEFSREAARPGSQYPGMVCRLWERIERETFANAERDAALALIRVENDCE